MDQPPVASQRSIVFGARGVGVLLAGLVMGQRSTLLRKPILVLYASRALAEARSASFS
jgi:hypothetical protein